MSGMEYDPAKVAALSDIEKNRLAIALLCHRDGPKNVDADKAHAAAGSTSSASFVEMLRRTLLKCTAGAPSAANTPSKAAKPGKKPGDKKRDQGEDDEEVTPSKKARKSALPKSNKAAPKAAEEGEEVTPSKKARKSAPKSDKAAQAKKPVKEEVDDSAESSEDASDE